ncbi:Uncharacterised protein [Shigella sonnei]|nr:Uncharacterised protein [Shigella sonnei]
MPLPQIAKEQERPGWLGPEQQHTLLLPGSSRHAVASLSPRQSSGIFSSVIYGQNADSNNKAASSLIARIYH